MTSASTLSCFKSRKMRDLLQFTDDLHDQSLLKLYTINYRDNHPLTTIIIFRRQGNHLVFSLSLSLLRFSVLIQAASPTAPAPAPTTQTAKKLVLINLSPITTISPIIPQIIVIIHRHPTTFTGIILHPPFRIILTAIARYQTKVTEAPHPA